MDMHSFKWTSLIAQLVKNLPAMQETFNFLEGRSTGEGKKLPAPVFWPGELVHGVTKSRTGLNDFTFTFSLFNKYLLYT